MNGSANSRCWGPKTSDRRTSYTNPSINSRNENSLKRNFRIYAIWNNWFLETAFPFIRDHNSVSNKRTKFYQDFLESQYFACKFLSSKGISVLIFRKCKRDMLQLPCTLWDAFSYSWTMPVCQTIKTERHKLYYIVRREKSAGWGGGGEGRQGQREAWVYHQPQLYNADREFCKLVFASLNFTLLVADITMAFERKRMVCRKGTQDKFKNWCGDVYSPE